MRLIRTAILLSALVPLCVGATERERKFRIYCADNVVRVESDSFEEMRQARATPVCSLSYLAFPDFATARKASKRFGGVGAPCRCVKAGAKT